MALDWEGVSDLRRRMAGKTKPEEKPVDLPMPDLDVATGPAVLAPEAGPRQSVGDLLLLAKKEAIRRGGPEGLKLVQENFAGNLSDEEMYAGLEDLMDFQDFQKAGMEYLESIRIVEKIDGMMVADLEMLRKMTSSALPFGEKRSQTRKGLGAKHKDSGNILLVDNERFDAGKKSLAPFEEYYQGKLSDFLFNVFYGELVISKRQYELWKELGKKSDDRPEAKPLFYSPGSVSDAFDIEKIKQAKFHLGLWEIPGRQIGDYSPFHKGLSGKEVAIACLIYHSQFGNGVRNEKGRLEVNFKDGSSRREITQKWIDSVYDKDFSRGIRSGSFSASPRTALLSGEMPRLYNSGKPKEALLLPDDFRILSSSETSTKYGLRREITNSRGMMMLNENVRYTLGVACVSKDGTKRFVVQISPDLGGITEIIDGEERLVKIFNLLHPGDSRLKVSEQPNTTVYRASINDINLRDFAEASDEVLTRRPDESEEDFAKRSEAFDFTTMLRAKQEVVRETGVSLESLSVKEQQAFLEYYRQVGETDKKVLYDFVKVHRLPGLKTFLATEYNPEVARKILVVGSNLDPARAGVIFEKFNSLIGQVNNLEEELKKYFFDAKNKEGVDVLQVAREVVNRAIALVLEKAPDAFKLKDLVLELDKIKEEMQVFVAVLAYLPREATADLNLKEIPAIQKITDITGAELAGRKDLLEKIKAIISKQFPAGDDEVFEREIMGNSDIRLTISLADGEVVSFFAKKKIDEGVDYVDWFISNPNTAIKGLGEATIRLGFNEEVKKDQAYYAVVKPHVKSSQIFIESLGFSGFIGSTADGEYKHHYLRVSRLPEDANLAAKKMSPEHKAEMKQIIASVCREPNTVEHMVFEGVSFEVCRVEFSPGIGSSDDIKKTDKDGWIMAEVERQSAKGNILTAYIPESNASGNKIFYVVFEKDISAVDRQQVVEHLQQAA